MRLILITCAVLALAACQKPEHQAANEAAPAANVGPHKGVDRSHKGEAIPNVVLDDGTVLDRPDRMKSPLVINIWATWCAPCVKELPTIDRMAKEHYMKGDLAVMAISQDSGPHASVEAFLKKLNIKNVGTFQDSKMRLSAAIGPDTVLPTTILYNANGKEVWRYVGDLDWTSPEAAKLLAEADGGKAS